jgi:glyoxylase-like metal-dependent hydrolase (beta-lactamase superfamily II)
MDYERIELAQPHYGGANAYRVGDTLVDTGHVCGESVERLEAALDDRLAGVERVVLTHPHIDHVGGSLTVDAVTGLPHVVYEGADALVRRYDDYLLEAREEMAALSSGLSEGEPEPDDVYFPVDADYATDEVAFERVVGHGDTVRVGPYECAVVHTPGHSYQHMALHHEPSGVMLSGDIVSTNGHFMYGPLHWDIGEYKTGLRRLREADPALLLPGHGDPMDDPAARVTDALEKARQVEQAVLDAVAEQGALAAHDLAVAALGATDDTVQFLSNVASAYAVHLAERGELSVERRPYVVARPA